MLKTKRWRQILGGQLLMHIRKMNEWQAGRKMDKMSSGYLENKMEIQQHKLR